MDIFDLFLQSGLITGAIVLYLLVFRKPKPDKGNYKERSWNYPLKLLCARYAVTRWKSQLSPTRLDELPRPEQYEGWDSFAVRTSATDGSTILLVIRKQCGRQPLAEIVVHVKLPDGTTYKLLQHPDTAVCVWENAEGGWSAGGLKIQVLEAQARYRFLFNGLMTRVEDGVTQHVKLNLIWASATNPVRYPDDWSNELAAKALALETWRDDKWPYMLGKWEEGGWLQFGTAQGRFQSFNEDGVVDHDVYLRTRGVKERSWAPHAYQGLRRSVTITAAARDGTVLQLRCLSYKKVLTHCIYGTVRYPDYTSGGITSTDLVMSEFCERADGIPDAYTINVSTKNKDYNIVLRINADGGKLFSGVPYQQETVYRTMQVTVNCIPGTGLLELGYQPTEIREPSTRITPLRILKWVSETQAGDVGYCVQFEHRACACTAYVGGKGASLALLATVQKDEGYRVPPGFCLTTKALDKHLAQNPALMNAIKEIEASNEKYDEEIFKDKCKKATELFVSTEISGDVKSEIFNSMKELRIKATEQKLGPELRFAVRSSAVGEDSEELSAAGQNDTILGCVSDEDVLRGVQKCWGSMFAFTSAYYRRQNGQPCLCGGGVVVQALVTPRAAGVMFTRHPAHGDPSRLLITANYGLGESVVSGAVEPDTIIVKRQTNGQLTITKTELGSKSQRVKTEGSGIAMEDVPEGERNVACLSEEQVLKLAKIGVVQEELWGAGRDIEWAVTENEIFLLQARPITSLDRWSEEELLHELDSPVMADDELVSFGNTGEVLPRPITSMTYDLVLVPLEDGMKTTVGTNGSGHDVTMLITHNRCALSLYNTIYKKVPNEIDINVRMVEMAIHGHKVAGDEILNTAKHRRTPRWYDKPGAIWFMIKTLMMSKRKMDDSIKAVNTLNYVMNTDDQNTLFDALQQSKSKMERVAYNHSVTSSASTCSQFVAMTVLLEGKTDFTPEQCNEISSLFSSGDVLSAEVPVALANLVQLLEASGLAEEFRALDPKVAMQWLKKNSPRVYLDVCSFLEHHGYRAIMEFDLVTKPWVLVPEDMMKMLQNLHVSTEGIKAKSSDEIIAALTSPEKDSTRKVLRWVLPLCRRTVRHRESTKAHLILAIHKLRVGFLQLGRLLVRKWYIPNPELVFHFRLHELRSYIANRDPALLKKALQRQQYHPGWCKLKFAELNTGWVNALELRGPAVTAGDVKIEATSVCGGEVVARACVVKDLSEISQLQRGDVLITHATDIGWSPYFPLLTGIVTELGGLISHGAVIAREYGLPCIVGAAFATDIFKTGDLVRLSGTKGIVEKVEVEENQDETNDYEIV
ncbi:rifampicin phosphotransferase-like [Anticarsia gemmatalis]|uniref:rifampicin phosphotransferase-like n=1 Tax=Anticarsia gemmatalis TaxID=129554 RepID=UPI003F77373B